jgi:predicted DNA-binding transcriptional regulator AlpA
MGERRNSVEPVIRREARSIAEFCAAHGISRASYYNIKRAGLGPREMRVGRSVRISTGAAAEWREKLESASANAVQ